MSTSRTHIRFCLAGNLLVPSGYIVACDPYTSMPVSPFTTRISPGQYPVHLSLVTFEDDEQYIGAASIRVTDCIPTHWEQALRPGQDLSRLNEGEFFGYAVSSGLACFLDAESMLWVRRRTLKNSDWLPEQLDFHRIALLETACEWGVIPFPKTQDGNLVFFTTGFGDSLYPSYWGYSADGRIAGLLTDFGIFDEQKTERARLNELYGHPHAD